MMKPDIIDIPLQKPDAIDSHVYSKPNTYDDDSVQEHEQHNTPSLYTLPQEVIDDLIVRSEFINGKRPDVKTNDEDDDDNKKMATSSSNEVTSSLISQPLSFTTELSTPPPVVAVVSPPSTVSPSASSISSNSSSTSNLTNRLALLQILKQKPMEDMLVYNLRKTSLLKPHEVDIYFNGTKKKAYKKLQPHSYSWGFQNILHKFVQSSGRIKVAEAGRRAFEKNIKIEWGDFPPICTEIEADEDTSKNNQPFGEDTDTVTATKSHELYNRGNTHFLFTYDTEFEGYRIRWKRDSLSHDLICEIKPAKSHQQLSEEDVKQKWRVIAEFDSHQMGYLIDLGQLIIDRTALGLIDRPDHFEAHIIVTCCTLIDLMREVVEKAVGISKGGVVGSN